MTAYDRDLHGWALEQAQALRARSANEIDWDNVAEEIESLGKQEVSELTSRLEALILHLLSGLTSPSDSGAAGSTASASSGAGSRGRSPGIPP